ncbi:peptidase domain-containing ABC transporter [Microbacterium sp. APC 3898]|uniref:Peptidase domain-containing ABC transporter n=1 Tax=Planococcus notacanthi TaxID=3035188 RepID=A0ABT7ZJR3_9BACL|nr:MULTISPECIES: peptidase domain-containing ABC transporter [Terrabacteria group]MDN3427400.1 peptidase domain-containing ABC transporter [Planococcus sp. APC 4016]MDN3436749.1 peptidase domain-containing ABC transporter [Planococcus sp. APC 3900]MDN3499684.1 peptidase domain-containing ABC transporter [Microbacterium sp. APC 3898]
MASKVPFIEQMEHSECGLASLAMVFAFHGKYVSLAELRESFGVPKGGTSLYQLMLIGKHYDMNVKGFKVEKEAFKDMALPAIIHWENKHYVVLESISKKHIVVVDPALGRRKIRHEEFDEKFTGFVLCLTPTERFVKSKGPSHIKFFLSFALGKPKLIFLILFGSLVLQLFTLVVPWMTTWITDNIIVPKNGNAMSSIGIGLFVLFISFQILSWFRGFLVAKLQTTIDQSLMETFIGKLLTLPYNFFENRSVGELLFRANSNVYIRQILSTKVISFLIDGILVFTYLAIMFHYSVRMTTTVLLIGITVFTLLVASTKVSKKLSDQDVSAQSKVQRILSESINGISDIKVMGLENIVFSEWNGLFHDQLKTAEKRSIWVSSVNTVASSVQFILPVFLLWYSSSAILSGSMTLGTVLGFNALAMAFITPIISIGSGYGELTYLGSYLQRLYDVMQAKSEVADPESEALKIQNLAFKGDIEFENVFFRHNHFSEMAIKDVSFKIAAGEKVAIVGSSGSGKSTIVKLLLGLYSPTAGKIKFDGRESSMINLAALRKSMGVVFQEARLFNKTIAENITAQRTAIEKESIIKAAKKANIHKEIMELPLNFDTTVSEFGANFSGGQRQRLLIARGLVADPPILVLDEATSALDTLSESIIDNELNYMSCTRVVIAHRLSTVQNADKIIVMDEGQIVEIGNHEELTKAKGYYYNLCKAQTLIGELKNERSA